MKYKILIAITIVAITSIVIDFKKEAHGNTNGAIAGVTGSPSDAATCAQTNCHNTTATAQAGWITSNIPGTGYVPGTTYTITATATQAALVRYGFEISPQNAGGFLVGTMIAGTGTQLIAGGKYITHTNAGSTGTTSSHTWTFTWIAPPSGSGALTFYGAFNCSNNDTHATGDLIYTSNLAVSESVPAGVDCGIFSIITPVTNDCSGNITPVVKLGNYGSTTLTAATINYQIDANTPATYSWMGSLATGTFTTVTLPALTSAVGAHTFTANTSAPNGGADIVSTNDSRTSNYTTTITGATIPLLEGFEATTFPPTGWTRINNDNATTWARNTSAHKTGVASAYIDNWNYSALGQRDELATMPVNLTSMTTPYLNFQVAYKMYSTTLADTLTVLISTDCGATWSQLYKKWGSTLASITTSGGTTAFVPTAAQWRQETISLAAYSTCSTALFRFINGTRNGNNLYLDDINIGGGVGVSELSNKPSVHLFPNPINDVLTVEYTLAQSSSVSVQIMDIQGKEIAELISEKEKSAGKYSTTVDMKSFKQGMYFITITAGNSVTTEKVMVER